MIKLICKLLSKNIHFKTMIFSLIKEYENHLIVNEKFKQMNEAMVNAIKNMTPDDKR